MSKFAVVLVSLLIVLAPFAASAGDGEDICFGIKEAGGDDYVVGVCCVDPFPPKAIEAGLVIHCPD